MPFRVGASIPLLTVETLAIWRLDISSGATRSAFSHNLDLKRELPAAG